jgi:bacterioferritin-associated ferredoxin
MIVCLCRAVQERTVRAVIAQGTRTVEAVGAICGAGTDCGACCPMLTAMIAESTGASCRDRA